MQNKKKTLEIVKKSIRQYEKNSEGCAKYRFKRFIKYKGNPCAEVYCLHEDEEPTEENIELWSIDFETGDTVLVYK